VTSYPRTMQQPLASGGRAPGDSGAPTLLLPGLAASSPSSSSCRVTVFEIMFPHAPGGLRHPPRWVERAATVVELSILFLILVNVALVISDGSSQTTQLADDGSTGRDSADPKRLAPWRFALRLLSTAVFTAEYLIRTWCVGCNPAWSGCRGHLRWACRPLSVIDAVCVAFFYVALFANGGGSAIGHASVSLRLVRGMRLLRVMQLLKVERQAHAFRVLSSVMSATGVQLGICLYAGLMICTLSGVLMFAFETSSPDGVIRSYWSAMYWSSMTITTVGYGEGPGSWGGQVLCSILSLVGAPIFVAVPAGTAAAAPPPPRACPTMVLRWIRVCVCVCVSMGWLRFAGTCHLECAIWVHPMSMVRRHGAGIVGNGFTESLGKHRHALEETRRLKRQGAVWQTAQAVAHSHHHHHPHPPAHAHLQQPENTAVSAMSPSSDADAADSTTSRSQLRDVDVGHGQSLAAIAEQQKQLQAELGDVKRLLTQLLQRHGPV
jgi:voltage-gated potassium channel